MQEARRRCTWGHLMCVGCGHCRCKGSRVVFKHISDGHTLCGPCRYGSMMSDPIYKEAD